MKATGIVRRIDDLGRVVIPKEIRRTLRIKEGDPLEIFTDREGEIILKKYSPIGELSAFAREYAEALAATSGHSVCITDRDQVVAAAGDSQRVQDLLAQIKSKDDQLEAAHADISGLKDRATAAEAREEEAWSMVSKAQDEAKAAQENLDYEVGQNDALHEEKGQLLRECEAAKQARAEAEARAKDAENQLAGSRQVAEAAKLRGDKLKAENDALKSQPITAVVDKEETLRQAKEMADAMNAELQAKLDAVTGDAEQDARNAYDSVLLASRAMLNTWQMVKPQFRKLPEEQREALANQIVHTIGSIQGEVTKCL